MSLERQFARPASGGLGGKSKWQGSDMGNKSMMDKRKGRAARGRGGEVHNVLDADGPGAGFNAGGDAADDDVDMVGNKRGRTEK